MRDLFVSERRFMQRIIQKWTKLAPQIARPVLIEHYAPPQGKPRRRFNNDFFLQLVPTEALTNYTSYGSTILPNTIGADVFVIVDKETLQPLHTELLGGESFPLKYFASYIAQIEDRLIRLSQRVRLDECAYSRVFVIDSEISFLAFPRETVPVMRGESHVLCADDDSNIACSTEADELIYVDGWIRTSVTHSEWKLWATHE